MNKKKRQDNIVAILRSSSSVDVRQLCKLFNVTNMTIRRDLDELEDKGALQRVHGGAVLTQKRDYILESLTSRLDINRHKKMAIAARAHEMIQDGSRIFLGSGSTTHLLATLLNDNTRLSIVTDAVNVGALLAGSSNISLMMVGGDVSHQTNSVYGIFAETMLKQLSYTAAFIGISRISKSGDLFYGSTAEVGIFRRISDVTRNIIILADSSKFGEDNLVKFGNLEEGYTIITDADASPELMKTFSGMGVNVITVKY